ncbi:MAG: tyrosine-type recombinase/integrase [Gammaproteobacteria bacterium]|nr:tyrosine-type recombinase/integrase [Gammaproteobacteria bacterium]
MGSPPSQEEFPQSDNPSSPEGRDRRLQPGEEERLLSALKHTPVVQAFVIAAVETAMRRGELAMVLSRNWERQRRLLKVPGTKTGIGRLVPLSSRAVRAFEGLAPQPDGFISGIRADSVTQAFNRARQRARFHDLRLHDLRHEAISRFFERRFNIMEVSAISGHRDLSMLKRYTHLNPETWPND